MNGKHPEVRAYLEAENERVTGRGKGCLCIVAAIAKVGEGELRDIVEDGKVISDEIATAVSKVIAKGR